MMVSICCRQHMVASCGEHAELSLSLQGAFEGQHPVEMPCRDTSAMTDRAGPASITLSTYASMRLTYDSHHHLARSV